MPVTWEKWWLFNLSGNAPICFYFIIYKLPWKVFVFVISANALGMLRHCFGINYAWVLYFKVFSWDSFGNFHTFYGFFDLIVVSFLLKLNCILHILGMGYDTTECLFGPYLPWVLCRPLSLYYLVEEILQCGEIMLDENFFLRPE